MIFYPAILGFGDSLQPLVPAIFAGYLQCQMRKPAVRGGSVPVLYPCGNIDHITRIQFLGFFSPFLIEALPGNADQNLSAALVRMMNMPVVAASGLKSDIVYANLMGGKGIQVALSHKI